MRRDGRNRPPPARANHRACTTDRQSFQLPLRSAPRIENDHLIAPLTGNRRSRSIAWLSVHSLLVRLTRRETPEANTRPAKCYPTTVRNRLWKSKRLIQSRVRQDRRPEELPLRNEPVFFQPEHGVL